MSASALIAQSNSLTEGVRSLNNNVFRYDPYWRTWSRILFHSSQGTADLRDRFSIPPHILTVELDLTPVNPDRKSSWVPTSGLQVRCHCTLLDGDQIVGTLPPRALEAMRQHLGPVLIENLLHKDYLPHIDWDTGTLKRGIEMTIPNYDITDKRINAELEDLAHMNQHRKDSPCVLQVANSEPRLPFEVAAGKLESNQEEYLATGEQFYKNYKYCGSFATLDEALVEAAKCRGYHFVELTYKTVDGKTMDLTLTERNTSVPNT